MDSFFESGGDFLSPLCRVLLLVPLGFIYLRLRYRDQAQRQLVLIKQYQNSYGNAGKALVERAVRGVLVLLLAAWLLVGAWVILGVFWNGLTH